MSPLIVDPIRTANTINEFSMLSQIRIEQPNDKPAETLFENIDGTGIKFFRSTQNLNFGVASCITHFSDLESLTIESSGPIADGFVASFPQLRQLTLKSASFDDDAIDEILSLENLEQLVVTKKSLSKDQIAKLLSSKRRELALCFN